MAIDKDTFEFQVCLTMLVACGADDDLTDEEQGAIAASLNELFSVLGKNVNSMIYLKEALQDIAAMGEEEMQGRVGFAINSIKVNLPAEQIKVVYENVKSVSQSDGMGAKEAEFLAALKSAWF